MCQLSFSCTTDIIKNVKADLYILFVSSFEESKALFNFVKASAPHAEMLLKKQSFSGKLHEHVSLQGYANNNVVHVMIFGIESNPLLSSDEIRSLIRSSLGTAIRYAEKHDVENITCNVPSHTFIDNEIFVEESVIAAHLTHYHFDDFITAKKKKIKKSHSITFSEIPLAKQDTIKAAIDRGNIIGKATNQARHWGDLPPSILYPQKFASEAFDILKTYKNITCKVFEKAELESLGMGGIIDVARGSMHEPRMVIAEYKTSLKNAPTIALVGKGVTFDTGGISIKPSDNMGDMKDDMAGAAAVLATMQAIAELKPDVNVIACAPMVENMPSGTALKPGDIVTFYNGKTAEVKNTDAEGRLILADALSYICANYKVDLIIDAATLTGSCAAALGPFFAGLMSKHSKHALQLTAAGLQTGDRVWELPLHDDYRKAIDCDVADICNIGKRNYKAGMITAAFFLREFVDTHIPWIHLDIAGVSMHVPDRTYFRGTGATGFGVRLFVEFLTHNKYHDCLK